jgi:hypothetical protein
MSGSCTYRTLTAGILHLTLSTPPEDLAFEQTDPPQKFLPD